MKQFIKFMALNLAINSVFVAADEAVRVYIRNKWRKGQSQDDKTTV